MFYNDPILNVVRYTNYSWQPGLQILTIAFVNVSVELRKSLIGRPKHLSCNVEKIRIFRKRYTAIISQKCGFEQSLKIPLKLKALKTEFNRRGHLKQNYPIALKSWILVFLHRHGVLECQVLRVLSQFRAETELSIVRLLRTTGVSWYVAVEFYLDHQYGALCGSGSYIIRMEYECRVKTLVVQQIYRNKYWH